MLANNSPVNVYYSYVVRTPLCNVPTSHTPHTSPHLADIAFFLRNGITYPVAKRKTFSSLYIQTLFSSLLTRSSLFITIQPDMI